MEVGKCKPFKDIRDNYTGGTYLYICYWNVSATPSLSIPILYTGKEVDGLTNRQFLCHLHLSIMEGERLIFFSKYAVPLSKICLFYLMLYLFLPSEQRPEVLASQNLTFLTFDQLVRWGSIILYKFLLTPSVQFGNGLDCYKSICLFVKFMV